MTPNALKFCKDCKWCVEEETVERSLIKVCVRPKDKIMSLVDGYINAINLQCWQERESESLCGPEAKYWEEKI